MSTQKKFLLGGIGVVLLIVILAVLQSFGGNSGEGFSLKSSRLAQGNSSYDGDDSFGLMAAEEVAVDSKAVAPRLPGEPARGTVTQGVERLIIKTGNMSVVVEDVKKAIADISRYAEEKNGFVVRSSVSEDSVAPYGEVVIRVPSDLFDEGFATFKGFGNVTSEQTSGQDVTEEFVDLQAQLKNLQATEAQFLEIMTRAEKIPDVLAVQRELSTVRGQIERTQGRMTYLQDSAAFSSITVYLSTDEASLPVVDDEDRWDPIVVVRDAVRSLLSSLQALGDAFIWIVVYSPVWIVLGVIGWLIYRWMKKRA